MNSQSNRSGLRGLVHPLWLIAVFFSLAQIASADQVGIDKARLIETTTGDYLLEVDTVPRFIAAFRDPVLPQRFELAESARERQAGSVVLRYEFRSLQGPMTSEDELLLPWGRAGVSITAQWSDGSVHQHLFLRDFEGIRVPIQMLKPGEQSRWEVATEHLRAGARHAACGWNHWLLILAIGLLSVGWWRFGLVALFAAGQAISLVLADFQAFVVTGEVAEVCIVVITLLLARAAPLNDLLCRRFAPVIVIAGVLHGLSIANVVRQSSPDGTELVERVFYTNLGLDAAQCLAAAILSGLVSCLTNDASDRAFFRMAIGGASLGLLLISISGGNVLNSSERRLAQGSSPYELPGTQMVLPGTGNRAMAPTSQQQPIGCYLSVEPYEIRVEVLIRLAKMRPWLELPVEGSAIEIAEQPQLKKTLIALVADRVRVELDGIEATAELRYANFVTVEPNGIYSRPTAIPELIDNAVVGVTFVFDTNEMANELLLDWSLFSSEINSVTARTTDPFGGYQKELTPDRSQLTWESRWNGYKPPEIKPVAVPRRRLPLFSVLLLAVAAGVYWYRGRVSRGKSTRAAIILLLALAYVSYPFARVSLAAPSIVPWRLSDEQVADHLEQLLTNVYRAYDMRDEEAIYDRLSLTVTGAQLTEIYLDTRRSLELENRGGARAKVDQVEVQEVHSSEPVESDGLAVDLTWTVSGSVTHFGHTHYRRNRYRAVVTIVPVGGHWKLKSIQIVEQLRLL